MGDSFEANPFIPGGIMSVSPKYPAGSNEEIAVLNGRASSHLLLLEVSFVVLPSACSVRSTAIFYLFGSVCALLGGTGFSW